jgi:hypothetical protein
MIKTQRMAQPCDTTDFCNRIGGTADIDGRVASAENVESDPDRT